MTRVPCPSGLSQSLKVTLPDSAIEGFRLGSRHFQGHQRREQQIRRNSIRGLKHNDRIGTPGQHLEVAVIGRQRTILNQNTGDPNPVAKPDAFERRIIVAPQFR